MDAIKIDTTKLYVKTCYVKKVCR